MTASPPYDLPRVLVVCDSTAQRRVFGDMLFEMLVETRWHLQLAGVAEYAAWCQPHAIVLALRDMPHNMAAYRMLAAAYGDSAAVCIGMLGVPQDGLAFPTHERLRLDSFLTPPPSLHELAWLIGRGAEGPRGPRGRGWRLEPLPASQGHVHVP